MRIKELRSHADPYVTVGELAEYWLVGRKQIYKQIDAGTLPAIRLGPRLLRIRTTDAIEFERLANIYPPTGDSYKSEDHSAKPSGRRRAR